MDSPAGYNLAGYRRWSAIGWRMLLTGAAVLAAGRVAAAGHPATALLLVLVALFAIADIMMGGADMVIGGVGRPRTLVAPALDMNIAREADRLRALLDTVSVALLAVDAGGRVAFANRAARRLAGAELARLDDIAILGEAAVTAILGLPPGARRIVRAVDGRGVLVWSGAFHVPGEPAQRLLSLQWVAGELDAVEIEAWHAMTRVLTHEMMNSLTPIVSLAESIAALPPEGRDAKMIGPALATIARRGTHLLHFIERYRALGDLPPPVPVMLDPAAMLADIACTMRSELEASGTTLSLKIDGPARLISADPELIERAMLNLLRNAAEAVRGGERPEVGLELLTTRDDVTIQVCDNGPGVPPDRVEDIFIPFFSTKSGGSGIGLPLARQIALLHGGSLVARSRSDGACFELRLPIRPGIASNHEAAA